MADVLPSDELTDDEPSDFGSLRPGTRLGRYELLVPIARGGMARVWAARQHGQRGFQKLVAIKTILPHLCEEPEFERMFLDEARIASGVHHPNVCEIYELGEEKRTLYLAMEWVTGDSVSRILRISGKTEAFDARVVARIIADACAGVHAAHELTDDDGRQLGVVHRDLSPHNILVTTDGVAKVCDFGVAKALGQLHEETSAGQLKGKISYMSPEQVTGAGLDRRSDVFSLGCVLYEASTGVKPFKGDRDHQIMHAILQNEIQPPSAVIRNYPPELERIVLRALAHQPILRYPTAERMRFALEEFLTKGQLVTTSNAAQVVRMRLGEQLEKRKERIKQASSIAEQSGWDPSTERSTRDAQDHRSGVKASQKPFAATLQIPQVSPPTQHSPGVASLPVTMSPQTPRMGAPHISQPPPLPPGASSGAASQRKISIPTPTVALTPEQVELVDQEQTIHGHDLAPVTQLQPQSPNNGGGGGGGPPPPMGGPTLTLPLGGINAMRSPLLGPLPAAGQPPPGGYQQQQQQQPQPSNPPASHDYSSPGHTPHDWSSPGTSTQAMQQQQQQNTMPPNSAPISNPYPAPPYDPQQQTQHSLPPSDRNAGAGERRDEPGAGAGQYAMAAFVGVLFAVLIGGGGFFIWHTRTTRVVAPAPPPSVASVATTASATTATATSSITFNVTPADATLSVDGRDLALGERSIPRPEAGKTMTLVVKAKDHEDQTILVDYFTNASTEIALKPLLEIDQGGGPASTTLPGAAAAASTSASVGASDGGVATATDFDAGALKPKRPRKDPNALPDNPY